MRWYQHWKEPETPYCIIWKLTYYGVVTACKVPESKADYYVKQHGFQILIRDSEFPVVLYDGHSFADVPAQSNPLRHDDPSDCA